MKKTLKKIKENLCIVEIKEKFLSDLEYYSGVTVESKLEKIIKEKLGLKRFEITIEREINCYGAIYRYALIETKSTSLRFRFLQFAGNYQSYELPIELV